MATTTVYGSCVPCWPVGEAFVIVSDRAVRSLHAVDHYSGRLPWSGGP
jgi:hypothetical protein